METIFDTGITLIFWLQSLGNGLIIVMKGFTFLGNEQFYLLIFPALYWCIDSTLGLRTGIILMISGIVNTYFKWAFHLPRPFWYSPDVSAHAVETGFGVPSGHSQNAVVVWGLIAASLRKRWAWIVAIFLIFFIGLSRMVLGMHFYIDVLAGWLLGAIILWLFLRFETPVSEWFKQKPVPTQLGFLLAISIAVILFAQLILVLAGDWEIPAVWIENAIRANPEAIPDPFSMSGIVSNAAIIFGLIGGAVVMKSRGDFEVKAPMTKLVARYVIGLLGVLVIWGGLDMVFPDGHDFVAYAFRYLRYGLAGFWMSLGAPWVFIRFKLAEPAQKLNTIQADAAP